MQHLTTVTIQVTIIKVVDETTDTVSTIESYGKLNTTDAKNLAKQKGFVFVSKESITNTHEIETELLIDLINK